VTLALSAQGVDVEADEALEGVGVMSGSVDARASEAPMSPPPPATSPSSVRANGEATITFNAGVDTNARRVIGEEAVSDAFAGLAGTARGELSLDDRHRLHGRYDLGLKKFFNLDAEDLMVQQLALGYVASTASNWTFEASANAKLRFSRNGLRDYLDLSGDLSARWRIARGLALKGELGVRHFSYPHEEDYGFWGLRGGLWGLWQVHRRLQLALGVRGALPTYEGFARASDEMPGSVVRRDRLLSLQLQASYRHQRAAFQGGYLWVGNWSNSLGESFQRHRVFVAMTTRLPWSVFVGLHLAWQTLHYPDGLYLSDDLIDLLLYDDESQSSSTLKLARPLTEHIEIELKYSLSWMELPRRDDDTSLSYLRQVGTISLVGRF
jgi:hypothetical protein